MTAGEMELPKVDLLGFNLEDVADIDCFVFFLFENYVVFKNQLVWVKQGKRFRFTAFFGCSIIYLLAALLEQFSHL